MALIGNRGFSRTTSTVTRAATNKKIHDTQNYAHDAPGGHTGRQGVRVTLKRWRRPGERWRWAERLGPALGDAIRAEVGLHDPLSVCSVA